MPLVVQQQQHVPMIAVGPKCVVDAIVMMKMCELVVLVVVVVAAARIARGIEIDPLLHCCWPL